MVRPAQPEEAEALAALGLAAWLRGIAPLVPQEVVARMAADNPFLPFMRAMGPRLLVAVVDGRAAGIGASEQDDDTISDLWVAPECEGRGAGSALVRALEAQIAGRGHERAQINVAAQNARAFGLYRHLGYREMSRAVSLDPILNIMLEKVTLTKGLR